MDSSKTSGSTATGPTGAGVFAKRVQRQFSRAQEKVLQKLGKSEETKDEQFEYYVQDLNDQQTDGNRIYKDLKAYLHAVKAMREASKRLSHSLFDAYESDWSGLDDLGAIVEGEDLLWNDYEAKVLDQSIRTMESYMSQFPDVKERVAKRNRKLVDYDSSRHHLEVAQTAKKPDEVKIAKADEEMQAAKAVYEDINKELKEELPVLFGSRIGCYVTVFQAIANLRDTLYKELTTINHDFQDVLSDLKAQHPDKVFVINTNTLQRSASLKRRSLISPRAWRASFSELHANISPRGSLRRKPTSPLRSVARPSLEGYSPDPLPPPTPDPSRASIDEVNNETSSSCSEHPPAEGLNGALGASHELEKVEEEVVKPPEQGKGGEPEAELKPEPEPEPVSEPVSEAASAGDVGREDGVGGGRASPEPADNTPSQPKVADETLTGSNPDTSKTPDSSVALENGEPSDSRHVEANGSSSHSTGAAAEESGPDRETVM